MGIFSKVATAVISQAAVETPAMKAAKNEGILSGLGIDTIIGSNRKKNKRYNTTTDSVGPEDKLLGV